MRTRIRENFNRIITKFEIMIEYIIDMIKNNIRLERNN